jgi:transcriptional regulator with XRE-family HTH domain
MERDTSEYTALIVALEQAVGTLEDRELFAVVVRRAMTTLDMTDEDVADKLPVSRSAVNRWRHGAAAPLPMMRKPVYSFFLRRARRRLAQLTDADRDRALRRLAEDSVAIPLLP